MATGRHQVARPRHLLHADRRPVRGIPVPARGRAVPAHDLVRHALLVHLLERRQRVPEGAAQREPGVRDLAAPVVRERRALRRHRAAGDLALRGARRGHRPFVRRVEHHRACRSVRGGLRRGEERLGVRVRRGREAGAARGIHGRARRGGLHPRHVRRRARHDAACIRGMAGERLLPVADARGMGRPAGRLPQLLRRPRAFPVADAQREGGVLLHPPGRELPGRPGAHALPALHRGHRALPRVPRGPQGAGVPLPFGLQPPALARARQLRRQPVAARDQRPSRWWARTATPTCPCG